MPVKNITLAKVPKPPRGLPQTLEGLQQLLGQRARLRPDVKHPYLGTKRFTNEERDLALSSWGTIKEAQISLVTIQYDYPSFLSIQVPWGKVEVDAKGLELTT